jgi:cyclopropane fatty-acyl-phospholipid synthase-like methyltransferase
MDKTNNKNEWFKTWFDSPYYSILYKNRSDEEAALFLDNLTTKLDLPDRARVLDLACGKGRHSIYLNKKHFRVVGIDLSNNSIAHAKKYETETLHFETGDMRYFNLSLKFDAIFNLFTSFGYFESLEDNIKVLSNIKGHLLKDGFFVMDYFNAYKVEEALIPHEVKELDGYKFDISKEISNGQIIKTIAFDVEGQAFSFQEKVQLLYDEAINEMLASSGFEILHTFGNYQLDSFNTKSSDRYIVIAKLK